MINKRLIPVVIIKDGLVVQSYDFNKYLPIGKPKFIIEYLSEWESDEIIVIDIDASLQQRPVNKELIDEISKIVTVPLTIGGGINSLEIAELYFKNGADKISINSLFLDNKFDLINKISEEYGSQSIVLSLDFFYKNDAHEYFLYDYRKKNITTLDLDSTINLISKNIQVGELLINSINRDGSKMGYDINLFERITKKIVKPILALGGANTLNHFLEISTNNLITGLCAGNVFLHSEHSVELFRNELNKKIPLFRPNNFFKYE